MNTNNNIKLKIGLTMHPHLDVKQNLTGGDFVVNTLIKKALEEDGYEVDFILLENNDSKVFKLFDKISVFPLLAKFILLKPLLIPFIYTRKINAVGNLFDVIICDSTVLYNIKHDHCINLFHGTYYGYRKRVGKLSFTRKTRFLYMILSLLQRNGAKNTYNVAVSNYVKKDMDKIGIKNHKVIVNSIDMNAFKPITTKKSKSDYLYAGGFSYYGKGFDVLEKLTDKGFNIDCVTNSRQGEKLNFFDSVDHGMMPGIYNRYKILLYPSRSEACQMVPLEAMACGLPVIISNVGIGPDLAKEIPEFVIDGHEEKAVNLYIQNIGKIKKNYSLYSRKARHYILKNHSYEKFKREWIQAIKEVMWESNA